MPCAKAVHILLGDYGCVEYIITTTLDAPLDLTYS